MTLLSVCEEKFIAFKNRFRNLPADWMGTNVEVGEV
jgi:hypothetical protein